MTSEDAEAAARDLLGGDLEASPPSTEPCESPFRLRLVDVAGSSRLRMRPACSCITPLYIQLVDPGTCSGVTGCLNPLQKAMWVGCQAETRSKYLLMNVDVLSLLMHGQCE